MVPKANPNLQSPSTSDGPALQHRLAQINSGLSTQVNFSPRRSSSAIAPFSNIVGVADPLSTNVSDSLPLQTTTPSFTQTEGWDVEAFLLYDALMPKAIAAGNSVKQHDLPWPVLQFRARSHGKPYSPRLIYSSDVTPLAVASFVRSYCAWKGWSLQVGRTRMLEDWKIIQHTFLPYTAGISKVRKVLQGLSSMV